MDFYHLQENIKKQLIDTGLNAVKTASKKVAHKAGEYIGSKIVDVVTKSNNDDCSTRKKEWKATIYMLRSMIITKF